MFQKWTPFWWLILLHQGVLAAPTASFEERGDTTATIVIPSPEATLLGNVKSNVESYGGIPYARPPVGPLRMKPPQRLNESMGLVDGTGPAGACPQFVSSTESQDFLFKTLGSLANLPFIHEATGQSEDCLSITVARPQGLDTDAKLPVLYWIFGGGFEVSFLPDKGLQV